MLDGEPKAHPLTTRTRELRAPLVFAILAASAYVLLAVLVSTQATAHLDHAAVSFFRPHDEWGQTQIRADMVVEGLKPRNVALLLPLVAIGASLRRSSWRPILYGALIAGAATVLTVGTKLMLERPDPHQMVAGDGGSFPSGHVVAVVVSLGGTILVLQERARWWEWMLVALVGLGMGLALLLQAAHWFTDVAGGALVATAVLAATSTSALRGPPRHQRR